MLTPARVLRVRHFFVRIWWAASAVVGNLGFYDVAIRSRRQLQHLGGLAHGGQYDWTSDIVLIEQGSARVAPAYCPKSM